METTEITRAEMHVEKTILSCTDFLQLRTAQNLVNNFISMYGYSARLYEVLDYKVDELAFQLETI